MQRYWGPTGVCDFVPFYFDDGTKKQIATDLKARGIAPPQEEFYTTLEDAISSYRSMQRLKEESKPARVSENLQKAIDTALNLNDALNNLDGNSRQLISEIVDGGIERLQKNNLAAILHALSEARSNADEYPKGRLVDFGRLYLAVDVADAIATHLKTKPTTSKESAFESVLSIVISAATGEEAKAVHDLARRALKAEKVVSAGLTEYLPPKKED